MTNTNNIECDHIPITSNEGDLLGTVTVESEVIEIDDDMPNYVTLKRGLECHNGLL